MRKFWILVGLLLVLLLAVAAFLWFGIPRLVNFSPQDGAIDVPANSSVSLTFSRPMQSNSVIARLAITPNVPGNFSWEGQTLIFAPVDPWSVGTTIQVHLAKGAQAESRLALPMQSEADWAYTIRQPRLIYLYPADGAANLYLYDPLIEENRALTELQGGLLEFDATLDGRAIYYSIQNDQNGSDIYRLELNPDMSVLRSSQVLACQQAQCRAPSISPGEEFLAYERTAPTGSNQPEYSQVWLVKLAKNPAETGGVEVTAADDQKLAGDELHQTIQPDWSPNGVLSFYDKDQQAFIVLDPRSGEHTSLPNQTGEMGSWDPNSKYFVAPEIFFNTAGNPQTTPDLQPIASSHLLKYNLEEGSIQDLTQAENLEDTSPAISPDGTLLAFARKYLDITRWTPGRQLWVMKPDGTDARQLTESPEYNHFSLAWSPAGNQIAFVRFNLDAPTEQPSIWLYNLDKDYEIELINGGYSPHWIP